MMNKNKNKNKICSWNDDDEKELRETIRIGKLIGFQFDPSHENHLRESMKADKAKSTKASTSKSNRRKEKPTGFQFEPAHEHNIRETMKADQASKASTSKSKPRKGKKSKFVSKPKQIWQVKKPTANWLELPTDLTANILQRIGMFDILNNAEKVCTTWRKICKDPAMWRVISMDNPSDPNGRPVCQEICKHVVDRSQGQLVDLSITDFCTDELLIYISDRASQLKRLEVVYCFGEMYGEWGVYLKKFPLLEELSLETTEIGPEDIEAVGRYCPLLKTLKLNQKFYKWSTIDDDEEHVQMLNETAIAIGKNLHDLRHLQLIGDMMTNTGLQAILDGCTRLESLDMRQCLYIDLKKDDMGKRCSERIKDVKLPNDDMEGYMHLVKNDYDDFVESNVSSESGLFFGDSDDDYYGRRYYDSDGYEYDDYTRCDAFDEDGDFSDFEDMNAMMAFFSMFK
ncbi:F-box protein SKIP19-like [Rutidosis leptorrhynchoides]|uniref:F-box protein SKIP19-like n=1 Tax=Rutidosis leptorrhynchoides TaxID=125765 RepID=UPI003A994703